MHVVGSGTIANEYDVAITPDGKNVYVVSQGAMTLLRLPRDPASGSLTFLGCSGTAVGCTPISGAPAAPSAMAVSPDSANLYVKTTDGLVIFNRNPGLSLTQKAGADGCFTETVVAGCTKAVGLAGSSVLGDIQVSPDGALVYTAFNNPGGVSFFNRFPNGTLTQITGAAGGCISSNGNSASVAAQCVDGNDGLASALTTATSPDGRYIYVGTSSGVIGYSRNPLNGVLGPVGCIGTATGARRPTVEHPALQHRHHRGRLRACRLDQQLVVTDVLPPRSEPRRTDSTCRDSGCFTAAGGACLTLSGLRIGGQVATIQAVCSSTRLP